MPFVLGHALYMKAIHGGQAKHDPIDSHKSATRLRGGMLPQASVYPAQRRATRDRLRRRTQLMRQRADLLAHVHHTHAPDHWPAIGKTIAYQADREGVAERLAEPAVHKDIEVALALITSDDPLLSDRELSITKTATQPDANTLSLLQTVPGIGKILSLVRPDESHDIHRFPRMQDFASSCRLVKCRQASGGNRWGTSGKQSGHAHLQWAFAEAAALLLRNNPAGQKDLARLENTHDTGRALTLLAHRLARAVSDRRKRKAACDLDKGLTGSGEQSGCAGGLTGHAGG